MKKVEKLEKSKLSSASCYNSSNEKSQCETENEKLAEILVERLEPTSSVTIHQPAISLLDTGLLQTECLLIASNFVFNGMLPQIDTLSNVKYARSPQSTCKC